MRVGVHICARLCYYSAIPLALSALGPGRRNPPMHWHICSYRGSVVAARLYGSALDTLINLDRFALYEQLRLQLPTDTARERGTNTKLNRLFKYDDAVVLKYRHPDAPSGS